MGNKGFHQWNFHVNPADNSLWFENTVKHTSTNMSAVMQSHELVWFEHDTKWDAMWGRPFEFGALKACWKKQ
jgi:hypothetical protein